MMDIKFDYPSNSQHCGAALGNGISGELIWGSGNTLNISVGSSNLWDHRAGMLWTEAQNFHDIHDALKARDAQRIKSFFAQQQEGGVKRPSIIPIGRVVITLPEKARLRHYIICTLSGIVKVFYRLDNEEKFLEFAADLSMQDALACRGLTPEMNIQLIPAYDLTEISNYPELLHEHRTLREHGFVPPEKFNGDTVSGFIQPMPADPSYALACRRSDDGSFTLAFLRGISEPAGIFTRSFNTFDAVAAASTAYFDRFWSSVPKIRHNEPKLQQVYCYSMFKYAIMTNPAGAVPGLQGPWFEDDRLPPWNGDYHFNINIQMAMLPGLKAGCFANLKKFFDMVLSWRESLRHNARCFAGIDNGYMLPHAVDDRAVCMGGFWPGTIDHACSAWVAQMMFDYCEYSGDIDFLRSDVYDFMLGVLRVYEVMMETGEDGKLFMPLTTSPEYGEGAIDIWGCNSSFQLAAAQQLAKNLLRSAQMLGLPPDEGAQKIRRDLPLVTICDGEIALWQDMLLAESHRHHSHLAGICPFEVIDPIAQENADIITKSIARWVNLGMGRWAGWSMPWASQIYSRCGNGDAAEFILKIWQDCFNNLGGASLHDGRYKGFTIIAQCRGEVMQIDGGMGAITAIQDQFMHVYDGELRLFFGIAPHVRNVSFENICAPGGMRVSGAISEEGDITVSVTASRDAELKLSLRNQAFFNCRMNAGEKIDLVLKNGELIRA